MRRALLLLAGVLALAGASSPATAQRFSVELVSITATGFNPQDVIIKPGDTVTWKNNDKAKHQIVADTGLFKSPVLSPGETYSYVFSVESSYSYHDATKDSMTGTVNTVSEHATVGITRLRVVYGNSVRVFGIIPTGATGDQVTLHIKPYGKPETTKTVVTDEGTYELLYRPVRNTRIFATWNDTRSTRSPTIGVRPRVVFSTVNAARNIFFVPVRPVRPFARALVRMQRKNEHGIWVTTKIIRLNARAERRFNGGFPHGTTRAWAWVAAKPGYQFGASAVKTIRR
jgi:plastocyanin